MMIYIKYYYIVFKGVDEKVQDTAEEQACIKCKY